MKKKKIYIYFFWRLGWGDADGRRIGERFFISVNIQITLKMSLKLFFFFFFFLWTTRFIIATRAMLDLLQSPVTKYLSPFLFLFFKLWWGYCERFHLSVHPYVCPDILLSMREWPTVRPSCYLFLNHWVEFYQTCYTISPHSMGVQEKHYFSICLPVRASIIRPFAHHTISFKTTGWNSTKLTASLPLTRCARAALLFRLYISSCVHLSVMLPILNHWVKFNQTTSLPLIVRKCARATLFFSESVCLLSVHHAIS